MYLLLECFHACEPKLREERLIWLYDLLEELRDLKSLDDFWAEFDLRKLQFEENNEFWKKFFDDIDAYWKKWYMRHMYDFSIDELAKLTRFEAQKFLAYMTMNDKKDDYSGFCQLLTKGQLRVAACIL
jgi:hypothetical protein